MDGADYFNRLPDCPVSGKVSFFSEGHARRWIRWKARKRRGRKCPRRRGWNPPHRVYQCRHCGRWHLTGSRNFIPREEQP